MYKLNLKNILDSPFFNELQDQMSVVTGISINTVDYKGTPLMRHSCCPPFCQAIRNHPVVGKRCQKCDALAGLEAVRQGKPFAYFCHCGLVDVAVPVLFGDQYLGAVILGQVRLPQKDRCEDIHPLIREVTHFATDCPEMAEELSDFYEQLPEMEYGRILDAAQLISMILFYIVSRKVDHRNDQITYEWMLNNGTYLHMSRVYNGIEPPVQGLRAAGLQKKAAEEERLPVPHSSVVYPAVRYIHRHLREKISLNSMANLCHLSPSYFSRVFQRDVGENFNEYVNRFKVQAAKEMIRNTNQSVSVIASSLGYRDTSYFIKVFKKIENMTPQEYKNRA